MWKMLCIWMTMTIVTKLEIYLNTGIALIEVLRVVDGVFEVRCLEPHKQCNNGQYIIIIIIIIIIR